MAIPAENHVSNKITVVGGVLESGCRLCNGDMISLRTAVAIMDKCGLPMSGGVLKCRDLDFDVDPAVIDVMNIQDGGHGGKRDFLHEKIDTDILVLANVAYKDSEHENCVERLNSGGNVVSLRERFQYADAMTVSPDNGDDDLWRRKIKDSKADIIVIIGESDFPPEKIVGDDYVYLKNMLDNTMTFVFSRDYLGQIKPMLKDIKSPLSEMAALASSLADIVEFRRHYTYDTNIKIVPVFPVCEPQNAKIPANGGKAYALNRK